MKLARTLDALNAAAASTIDTSDAAMEKLAAADLGQLGPAIAAIRHAATVHAAAANAVARDAGVMRRETVAAVWSCVALASCVALWWMLKHRND